MLPNVVFNTTICTIGIALLLIHTVNILLKRDRRDDENKLLIFIVFTIVHFATYLTFILINLNYKSDNLIMGFYTTFYIMNNIEVLLLFMYTTSYISLNPKFKNVSTYISLILFFTFVILDVVNIFNRMFFTSINGGEYFRQPFMFFSQGYQLIVFASVFFIAAFSKKLFITEKISFFTYCVLPFVAIVIQNLLKGFAIAYLSIIISIEIMFLFVNVKKNLTLVQEEKRNKEAEIKLMMSQIKPHFIYNTLSSISSLIKIDPPKAQKALDDFTEYLRSNLSSLNDTGLIFFNDELKHVKTYLSLEKLRFDERLEVIYDIKAVNFLVPPLSIQPIVENAVKHGILQKLEGGVITIKTYEKVDAYVIEVNDNGVGFDPKTINNIDNKHIGINNVKSRLASMCQGELRIYSQIGKGTTVVVTLYK